MTPPDPKPRTGRLRRYAWGCLGLLALIVAYYVLGSWAYFHVGDDPAFLPPSPTIGGSKAVDMAAALIERETVTHAWQPNDPVFMPNGILNHPSAFQTGMQGALARFAIELEDQIGRTRGSSAADPDLGWARGLLNFPPDIWFFDFSKA